MVPLCNTSKQGYINHPSPSFSAGLLCGHKIVGIRMLLEDGVAHLVDSSELAFKQAAIGAMRTFFFEVRNTYRNYYCRVPHTHTHTYIYTHIYTHTYNVY